MLSLVNFFEFGIEWTGEPDVVMLAKQRRSIIVLLRLAHLTNVRNPAAGVTTGKLTLGGKSYSERNVARALSDLQQLGIIKRTRNLTVRRSGWREGFATTCIDERLIEAAEAWAHACASAKKDKTSKPLKTKIAIPLISTVPPENPSSEPLPEGRGDKLAVLGMTNCHTQTITPPAALEECAGGVMLSADEEKKMVDLVFGSDEEILNFEEKKKKRDHDFRRFTSWTRTVNQTDDLEEIGLLPAQQTLGQGWLEMFGNLTKTGADMSINGLAFVEPKKFLGCAAAKKQGAYMRPRDGSRLLLLDDMKTSEPQMPPPYAILETSQKNYQHIYCADKPLSNQERHIVQKALAERHGGDPAATSGSQPHRVPGSINYKPGRRNFWTRLVLFVSEGEGIKTEEFLLHPALTPPPFVHKPQKSQKSLSILEQSESEKDYAECFLKLAAGEEVSKIEEQLAIKSAARGKHKNYAKDTVAKAVRLFSLK